MARPPLTMTVGETAAMLGGVGTYNVRWLLKKGLISYADPPERRFRRVSLISVWHYLGATAEEVSFLLARYAGLECACGSPLPASTRGTRGRGRKTRSSTEESEAMKAWRKAVPMDESIRQRIVDLVGEPSAREVAMLADPDSELNKLRGELDRKRRRRSKPPARGRRPSSSAVTFNHFSQS